jgi:hypothetical protein
VGADESVLRRAHQPQTHLEINFGQSRRPGSCVVLILVVFSLTYRHPSSNVRMYTGHSVFIWLTFALSVRFTCASGERTEVSLPTLSSVTISHQCHHHHIPDPLSTTGNRSRILPARTRDLVLNLLPFAVYNNRIRWKAYS